MVDSSKRLRGIRQNVRYRPLTQNVTGMVTNRAERFMPASAAVNVENMHAESEGSWTANQIGYTNLNTQYESGADFQGLHWYTRPNGTDYLVGAINAKLIEINTSDWTKTNIDTSTGFSTDTNVDFQTYDGYLYSCDGDAATPRRWDGTTATASGGWPAMTTYSNPRYVEEHNGRLVYCRLGDAAPSHVVFSSIGDGEDFPASPSTADDGIALEVGTGDGQQITGMKSVFIPQSNDAYLAVAKERSLYVITGYSALAADADYFQVIRVNNTYGAVNNKSMVQVGNDLLMLGELPGGGFGFISYTTALQNGTLQPSLIGSDYIKPVLARLNRSARDMSYAVHFPSRREVVWGVPLDDSTTVNYWIVYKYPAAQDELPKWSVRTQITHAAGLVYQGQILFGSIDGYLSRWFTTSTYNGTSISWRYEMPYTDFGIEGQYKRIPTAIAHFKSSVNAQATIEPKWLGGGNANQRQAQVNLGDNIGSALYGTAIYGTDRYTGQVEIKRAFKVYGNGERLKYTLSGNTGTSGGPEFLGITQQVEYGGTSHHYK